MKLFIVEDEFKIREELKILLESEGYQVKVLSSFQNVVQDIIQQDYDLLLLDINLPNENGFMICKEVKKHKQTPIIFVTSRNTEEDELNSILSGGDDFVTKPYNPLILLARIEAVLKRVHPQKEMLINYRNIQLDVFKSCIIKDKQIIDLSKNELKIFYYLLSHQGVIISRDELMSYLWDSDMFVDDNTLTVNINRLRKKLEDIGLKDVIITKRKQGYLIL